MAMADDLLSRCVAVDLEVDPRTARIFAFAAVRGEGEDKLVFRRGKLEEALDRLEAFAGDADFLAGHNIIHFDLPHLAAVRPRLAALGRRPIDTLWLNPLAFPRNPYHRLVKHHQDGRLQAGHVNDPELDARLVFEVLGNQLDAFRQLARDAPDAVAAYHFLTTSASDSDGFDAVFSAVRGAPRPDRTETEAAIRAMLAGRACTQRVEETLARLSSPQLGWPMAYALSWISVAGGDSVMPPWVRARFREAALIVRHLRDTACDRSGCAWCREKNDPGKALSNWFGFSGFRAEPADEAGRPLQERIVAEAMAGRSILGILPTGTGKSVCYQLPALARFDKTGALTVVISPLVALMADQVQGLARQGISACVTINGLLSMPERHAALDKVRMGDAAILLISPEQLRNPSVRGVLKQREVGYWVLDEAHCISKWGHDFRPDYRYVARFIREFSGDEAPAPVICLTATAKPEVIRDIREHFSEKLEADLLLLDGGAVRTNLAFEVLPTSGNTKLADILGTIARALPAEGASGAIVYCATRAATEDVARFLQAQGLSADYFHAGLRAERKREVQDRFQSGELRIIAATNAFGMGIDKPDIRLVVHGDIPGSLENYLQEAGRAGRDREQATCVLLFNSKDVERQFNLSARSRLARHEIGAILKALRRLDTRARRNGEVVATPGEIVREERDRAFERDSATDDTRVRTAVAWLEEAGLAWREENRVQIFPSSLRVRTLEEAAAILDKVDITAARRRQLLDLIGHMMNAPRDAGVTTDELAGASGLAGPALRKALADLEALGIANDDTAITVFVHVGVEGSSAQRFQAASRLEADLIATLREAAPDAEDAEARPLHLAATCQALRDRGHDEVRPDLVERHLRSMAQDGRDEAGGRGNLHFRKAGRNSCDIRLQRPWDTLARTAELRRNGAELLLRHLEGLVQKGTRGKDIQVETTMGKLHAALAGDALLKSSVNDLTRLLDRALLWLHEQGIATLGRGLTIFRSAITMHLKPGGRQFTQGDFLPLDEHYAEQTVQTHIMAAYAERGLESIGEAERLSQDYFTLDREAFLRRWLPGRGTELRRQTTTSSWKAIVDGLDNRTQARIVADDREQVNVLVLAGPGSGKTRVLVHRIAYLIRVRREDPRGILVLTYNRHAAVEIRERLKALIGEDAAGITVSTCHALAMRLIGASFAGRLDVDEARDFDRIVADAAALLRGDGLPRVEAEAMRDTLIEGYRWILVDEYQDVGKQEYALIAAVAGRSLEDPDLRLSLFAVGDDDQNIYAFKGASVAFIRQFEADYAARPAFLTENYRSTRNIIEAANRIIAPAANRMKVEHDITVDRRRLKAPPGGRLEALDPVARGRVQLLRVANGEKFQAAAAVDELERLSRLVPDWSWSRAAIIARKWRFLDPVLDCCKARGIPVQLANEDELKLWRLREFQQFVTFLRNRRGQMLTVGELRAFIGSQPDNRWRRLLAEGVEALGGELADKAAPAESIVEWLADWSRAARQAQRGLLLLTAHRAKGLEFDHVVILDGGWGRSADEEDADAERRLFYVAATRARESLAMTMMGADHPILGGGARTGLLERRITPDNAAVDDRTRRYRQPDLTKVDLSYAGRLGAYNPTLPAIASLGIGDPLGLVNRKGRWLLTNARGVAVGAMANDYRPPSGMKLHEGKVRAVIRRRKADNAEEHRDKLRRDEWEVVLPKFVFAPERD